jgi:GTPase SAR1 family protein
MSGKLPIMPVDQRLSQRRSIKVAIFGKSGAGKTSLLPTLPPDMTLFFDLEDGSPEPEVRS